MKWFDGSVSEAIAACKSRQAVFVVFVEGQDDSSKNALATVEDNTISSQLESDDFIVIKLDSRSESYRQFAQIYQLVPVPSLFFIGANGTPLEVVAGEVTVPDLAGRIKAVLVKCGKTNSQDEAAPQSSEPVTSSVQANGPTTSTSSARIVEKVEHARELIEKKKKEKEEEEERLERNREMERRRVGQEVQKLRRWQQEQEMKELREQRRKEKLEEQAARQRVLDQITQDRAERAAKTTTDVGREQREEPRAPASRSDVARIQFRLPDGSSHTHSFTASTPLSEVSAYAAANLNLPFREFAMSTTFPRREFTADDNCRTVSDLELVPTAVILILPASSSAVVRSPGYFDVMTRMVWSLLAPLAALYTYLRQLVYRRGSNPGGSGSNAQGSTTEGDRAQSTRRRQAHVDSTSGIQRQGNIHRLTTRRDSSDDENNTWNGNSTQQM